MDRRLTRVPCPPHEITMYDVTDDRMRTFEVKSYAVHIFEKSQSKLPSMLDIDEKYGLWLIPTLPHEEPND